MSYLRNLRGEPGAPMRGRVRSVGRNPNAGKSLAKRRRWYADGEEDTPEDGNQPGADDDDDGGESDKSEEDDVPELLSKLRAGDVSPDEAYAIISGLRSENAESRQAKKDLKALQEAQEAEKRKAAEEQGKFQELWEGAQDDLSELKQLREARVARLEKLSAQNDKRIGELPKDKQAVAKGLIETAGADDPDKVSALLDQLIPELGTQQKPPPNDGGSKGDSRKQTGSTQVKLNKAGF